MAVMKSRVTRLLLLMAAMFFSSAGVATVRAVNAPPVMASGSVRFATPTFVDNVKAGGEPLVLRSTKAGNLVYTSHEGTTHIDREGLPGTSVAQFLCPSLTTADCYKNHVWIWTSDDRGKTWQPRDEGLQYSGFSDPDLTEDAAGTVYNTGIDLANESVFSSRDGGKTWTDGTPNCAPGDRPWLAGGVAGEVFMGTDPLITSHTVYHSTDYAHSCGPAVLPGVMPNGVVDAGTLADGTTWSGFGKLIYDRFDGSIIEPAVFTHPVDAGHPQGFTGVGYSRLPRAAHAFAGGGEVFTPHEVSAPTTIFSPFGAPEVLSMDSAENLYFAWDTNDRAATGTNGCDPNIPGQPGGPTPAPNHIMFAAGRHTGPGAWEFSTPVSISQQGNARVLWPWSIAGSPGNVSVVWYQLDQLVDPDCDLDTAGAPAPGVKTYIYEAHITNATSAARSITITNASGRPIHQGGICNSGTTCVATGQDRRLGDFFTNAVDEHGCVLIASGDTTVQDAVTGGARATSLPIFIQQNSGPSLTGQDCGAVSAASVPPAGPPGIVSAGPGTPNTGRGLSIGVLAAVVLVPLAGVAAVLGRRRVTRR
ncbi:MAG: hypothetical protein NVSMB17_11360 [Candidatus Dormibacteria bacterium]